MNALLLALCGFNAHGALRAPVRPSAVSMGPIRAIKRLIGIQKQNFLEANVRERRARTRQSLAPRARSHARARCAALRSAAALLGPVQHPAEHVQGVRAAQASRHRLSCARASARPSHHLCPRVRVPRRVVSAVRPFAAKNKAPFTGKVLSVKRIVGPVRARRNGRATPSSAPGARSFLPAARCGVAPPCRRQRARRATL